MTARAAAWAGAYGRGRGFRVSRAAACLLLFRVLLVAVLLACWQAVGGHQWFADGAVPAPQQVWDSLRADWGDYGPHVQATLWTALWGFLIGNAIGCALAFLYLLWPVTAPVTRGLVITLFCMPIAIVAPLLGVMLPLLTAKIVIASMWSVFNMQVALLLAMRQVPPGSLAVVESAGGAGSGSCCWSTRVPGCPGSWPRCRSTRPPRCSPRSSVTSSAARRASGSTSPASSSAATSRGSGPSAW